MLELTLEQISMAQSAVDKTAALKLIADHLVADGLVAEGYLTGLMNREQQGSTFLGQGIAIPHGTPETRDLVFTTGVRLMQFPEGVDWGDGQMVYLAIGIAAKSDEHLRLLQLLIAGVFQVGQDEAQCLAMAAAQARRLRVGSEVVLLDHGFDTLDRCRADTLFFGLAIDDVTGRSDRNTCQTCDIAQFHPGVSFY